MKQICFISILFLIGCNQNNSPSVEFADEFNYSFFDPSRGDSIHCIQVGSSSITPYGDIPLTYIKHELVDTSSAYVKIIGKILNIDNEKLSITFEAKTDTITASIFEKTQSPQSFINRTALFNGEIQLHPKLNFEIESYLVLDIKKAPIQ